MSEGQLIDQATAEKYNRFKYEQHNYKTTTRGLSNAAGASLVLAILLFTLSWFTSGATGVVNQNQWLASFAVVSFVAGCVCTVVFFVMLMIRYGITEPYDPRRDV